MNKVPTCAPGSKTVFVRKASLTLMTSALLLSGYLPRLGATPALADRPQQLIAQTPIAPLPVEGVGQPNNQLNPNRGHFSLAILQAQSVYPEVIARVSLKSQRPNAYLQERLIGDFRYRINQRAQFIRGLNTGDRVVVRLFTPQNELIGYSEFELLSDFAVVNLVLPSQRTDPYVVRTIYGMDADQNSSIDAGSPVYDYFTQVTGSSLGASRVTFLSDSQSVNASLFRTQDLPAPATAGMYPDSFQTGTFALSDRTLAVFNTNLAPALTALPGQMVQITSLSASGESIYEVSRLILVYREVGVSEGTIVQIDEDYSSVDDNDNLPRRR